jgi:putative transposase
LRYLLDEFLARDHLERPHQGLDKRPLSGADLPQALASKSGDIECHERLGGLLKDYRRRAA